MRRISQWLDRPQASNRDATLVGVVASILSAGLLYGGGKVLDTINVINFGGNVPGWLAALLAGGTFLLGLVAAGRTKRYGSLQERLGTLEARTNELEPYGTYAEHVRDALGELRLAIDGELPNFSLRDFVEIGVFQPAQSLLTRGDQRGQVRFSVLHPDESRTEFVMAGESGLFPALGHRPESRQNFRLEILGSFSELAFRSGKPFASNELSTDDRFTRHPRAAAGREYESIVSVPLRRGTGVDGVLNVVATKKHAFSDVDQTYIGLLGSLVDVARSVSARSQTHQTE